MAKANLKNKAINLTRQILRYRNRNLVKREQTAYQNLLTFCQNNKLDFNHTLENATLWLKNPQTNKNYIADMMNGIV